MLAYLKKLSGEDPTLVFRKRHGSGMGLSGDPDVYVLWKGRHFEIELKRSGEDPTPLQRLRLEEWGKAGALVGVVRSLEDLREILARV